MAVLDATNIAILGKLQNGRKPFREIAEDVGVTENTVRSRVNRMQDDGVLEFCGGVNSDRVDGMQIIFVGVKLNTMDLSEKAEELSLLTGVVSSAVVTGRYDVFLTVLLTEKFGLLEFYKNEISQVKDIRTVETFVVYQGYNLRVPMIHGAIHE